MTWTRRGGSGNEFQTTEPGIKKTEHQPFQVDRWNSQKFLRGRMKRSGGWHDTLVHKDVPPYQVWLQYIFWTKHGHMDTTIPIHSP